MLPFLLGNGHPVAFTWFVVCLSLLSVVLSFFVLKKLSGIYGAVLATILYSFAGFSVATTKFIWNPYPIVWLMPLYVLGLFAWTKQKPYGLPLAAGVTGLGIHFEAISGITLIPTLGVMGIMEFTRHVALKQKAATLFVSLLVFALPFLPNLLFDLRHNFLISSALYKTVATGGANITHRPEEIPLPLAERIRLRTDDLLTYTVHAVTPNKTVNVLLFILLIAGGTMLYRKKRTDCLFVLLVVLTLLTPFCLFLTLKYSVWSYYWLANPPLYSLLLAFVLASLVKDNRKLLPLLFVLIGVLLVAYNPLSALNQWQRGDLRSGGQTFTTQRAIVQAIYKDAGTQDFSVYVLTPPVYDYVYRYLLWWQGTRQFHNLPKDEKQRLVYVILEQNPSDPDGTFFKKNVVRTARKPTKTFRFPGVRVEKIMTAPGEPPFDRNYLPVL